MKRLLLAALLCLTPLAAAKAYIVLTQTWVFSGAVADFDFVNGHYYSNGFVGNIQKYFTVTRTQTTTNSSTNLTYDKPSGFTYRTYPVNTLRMLDGGVTGGVFSEVTRTNIFLNSTVPVTQTTPSMPTGTWILWVNGSGSATIAGGTATGCASGTPSNTASQGVPITITITVAGTCSVGITGSLNAVQLEQEIGILGGPNPTSFIPTAGAAAFRGNDAIQFPSGGFIQALAASGTGTVMCQITRPHLATAAACFAGTSASGDDFIVTGSGGGSFISRSHANVLLTALDGSPSNSTTDQIAVSWDGSGRCIVWNGGTPACDANTFAPATVMFAFGINGGSNPTVPGKRLTFWSTKLSTATMQILTKTPISIAAGGGGGGGGGGGSNNLLLADVSSKLLLSDTSSKLCLTGGC